MIRREGESPERDRFIVMLTWGVLSRKDRGAVQCVVPLYGLGPHENSCC